MKVPTTKVLPSGENSSDIAIWSRIMKISSRPPLSGSRPLLRDCSRRRSLPVEVSHRISTVCGMPRSKLYTPPPASVLPSGEKARASMPESERPPSGFRATLLQRQLRSSCPVRASQSFKVPLGKDVTIWLPRGAKAKAVGMISEPRSPSWPLPYRFRAVPLSRSQTPTPFSPRLIASSLPSAEKPMPPRNIEKKSKPRLRPWFSRAKRGNALSILALWTSHRCRPWSLEPTSRPLPLGMKRTALTAAPEPPPLDCCSPVLTSWTVKLCPPHTASHLPSSDRASAWMRTMLPGPKPERPSSRVSRVGAFHWRISLPPSTSQWCTLPLLPTNSSLPSRDRTKMAKGPASARARTSFSSLPAVKSYSRIGPLPVVASRVLPSGRSSNTNELPPPPPPGISATWFSLPVAAS